MSLRRRVALKVLPFAAAIDPRRLQRFKNEALAAAHLQHENIVPVHAVGCERGVHFYAMQFIDGQSLAALIGALRLERGAANKAPRALRSGRARRTPSRETSSARRFRCRGMVLGAPALLHLGGRVEPAGRLGAGVRPPGGRRPPRRQAGQPAAGRARATLGHRLRPGPGRRRRRPHADGGTARHAALCQSRAGSRRPGVVDHRSDVYSLGATLYELLTLRPIFEGRDRKELMRQIADDDPPRPRSVVPAVPAELETIVLKALRKEPSDRYPSARSWPTICSASSTTARFGRTGQVRWNWSENGCGDIRRSRPPAS